MAALIIHGRSDATLNPGGVRIGTAEIYAAIEGLAEIEGALCIGQDWQDDTRVVLFVKLREGAVLDDALRDLVKAIIRGRTSPRHIPTRIVAVSDLPRTRSGKLAELAVRDIVHGQPVRNADSLANPESLTQFVAIRELTAMSAVEAVHIVAARRTAIGRLNGGLAGVEAARLGSVVVRQCLADTTLDPQLVDEVIMGHVLTAGAGQNPARQAAIWADLPDTVPAFSVNKVCGSGLKAIQLAALSIRDGDAGLVVAGGQESMSRAPHLVSVRQALKVGDMTMVDSVMHDGLVDAFHHVPMGMTAEHLARKFHITRDEQDAFALRSQQRALAAAERFASEIVPVTTERATVARDEQPRADSSLQTLGKLRPAFEASGTVTAGNAASLNDGAAAVIIAGETQLGRLGLEPMARIVSCASAALEPMEMGLGAAKAAESALHRAGWTIGDVDLVEINEAFAVQALAVIARLGVDPERVNVNGGAIALGHPIGASGTRIVVTLLHELRRRGAKRGLASVCIGGGQGIAICVERL